MANIVTPEQAARIIDGAIRVLYNSYPKIFDEIFGATDGPYLWDKFTNHFDAAEGSFICYLDSESLSKLTTYVLAQLEANGGRI